MKVIDTVNKTELDLTTDQLIDMVANQNRQVQVLAPAGAYGGICRGINAAGELLVEREGGTVEQVMSGEVSVRGIYGYV